MALTTIPTFTPSGFLQMSTPPAPLPNATEGYLPPLYGNVANTLALPAGSSPATVLIQNLGPEAAVVLLTTAAATTTGTASAGSVTVTLTSGTDVAVGQAVVGPGMNQGTFVAAISGTTLTISQPTTEAITTGSGSLNFIVPVTLPPAWSECSACSADARAACGSGLCRVGIHIGCVPESGIEISAGCKRGAVTKGR